MLIDKILPIPLTKKSKFNFFVLKNAGLSKRSGLNLTVCFQFSINHNFYILIPLQN